MSLPDTQTLTSNMATNMTSTASTQPAPLSERPIAAMKKRKARPDAGLSVVPGPVVHQPDAHASPDTPIPSVLPAVFPVIPVFAAPVDLSGKDFDIEAEKVRAAESGAKAKSTKKILDKCGEKLRAHTSSALAKRDEIEKTKAALVRMQAELKVIEGDKRHALSKDTRIKKKYDGYEEQKKTAEFYIQLKKSVPLTKLPDEIKVMILKLVFEPEKILEVTSFKQLCDLALHPFMSKSSGFSGLAAQVVFGSSTLKITDQMLAKKVFTKHIPRVLRVWIKGVEIDWIEGMTRMADSLLLCTRLESLTLTTSFLVDRHTRHIRSPGDKLNNGSFMRKLVEKLPLACKVTIVDGDVNPARIGAARDSTEKALHAEVQAAFDDRTLLPVPKKTRGNRKTVAKAPSPSPEANGDASAETDDQTPVASSMQTSPLAPGISAAQAPANPSGPPDSTSSGSAPHNNSTSGTSETMALPEDLEADEGGASGVEVGGVEVGDVEVGGVEVGGVEVGGVEVGGTEASAADSGAADIDMMAE